VVTAALARAALAGLAAPAGGAPGIGRRAAQRLARAELAKPIYHHLSLAQRIAVAIARFFNAISRGAPGGWWGLVALAALAVIVTAGLQAWMGPVARAHRGQAPLTPQGQARTARDHRQDAGRLADAGDYAGAIRECVRAIAAELDERGVLPPRTGRTANEFAEEAGRALPAHAAALREAAWQFDEVCYGQRAGTRDSYERLHDLDKQVMASAPRVTRAAPPAPVLAGGTAS
jgi:Domain of unknown function (DUF4129)